MVSEGFVRDLVVLIGQLELVRHIVQIFFLLLRWTSASLHQSFAGFKWYTHMLRLQIFFQCDLLLVQSAKFVDPVLIFSPDLNLVGTGGSLVFFR